MAGAGNGARPPSQRVGYVRVSTVEQNTERQLDGVQLDKTFTEKASAKDAERPQLKAALEYLREGDTLIVHSLDRLARNLEDLCRIVRTLTADGVAVSFVKENLHFTREGTTPFSELLLHMLGAVAQFERALIRERQREGIEQAKKRGAYKGRRPGFTPEDVQKMKFWHSQGWSKAKIARTLTPPTTRQTVHEYLTRPEKYSAVYNIQVVQAKKARRLERYLRTPGKRGRPRKMQRPTEAAAAAAEARRKAAEAAEERHEARLLRMAREQQGK